MADDSKDRLLPLDDGPELRLVPVTFSDACAFVAMWHRHHAPPIGHKFSVGAAVDGKLVGVAMVGRPVARHLDDGLTLEVNRTATDGTRNVNSLLIRRDRGIRAAHLGFNAQPIEQPEGQAS